MRLLESFPRKIRFSEVKIAKAPELRLILLTISIFLLCISLHGQEQAVTTPDTPVQNKRVIQFTGVVMEMDSFNVIPGVHVYLPKGGRGTTTNPYGFFSIAVVEGDSIVFSAVGINRTNYIAASPAMNQRYFQDQQVQMFQNKFGPQTNNLLNPWAWNSFIRSIKGN